MNAFDADLRDVLLQPSPSARDQLRTALIRDDRDEIAQQLLRYGDANGDGWADVIDTLTMYPDMRRQVVRLLAECRWKSRRITPKGRCANCNRRSCFEQRARVHS